MEAINILKRKLISSREQNAAHEESVLQWENDYVFVNMPWQCQILRKFAVPTALK